MRVILYQHNQVRVYKVIIFLMIMVLAARVAAAEAAGNWIYEKVTQDADQKELSTATVRSRNSIRLLSPYAGVNHGLIMIRMFKGGEPEVLFAVDKGQWKDELDLVREQYATFGTHLPKELAKQIIAIEERFEK